MEGISFNKREVRGSSVGQRELRLEEWCSDCVVYLVPFIHLVKTIFTTNGNRQLCGPSWQQKKNQLQGTSLFHSVVKKIGWRVIPDHKDQLR